MDSELLLKFIGYLPDYLSALSRTLLRYFGQPLSKQLYILSNSELGSITSRCSAKRGKPEPREWWKSSLIPNIIPGAYS